MVLSKIKMCNLKLYKNVAHKKNLAFNGNKKIPYIKSRWNVLRWKEIKIKIEIPYFA